MIVRLKEAPPKFKGVKSDKKKRSRGVNVLFVFVNRLCQDREEREVKEMKRQSKWGGNKYNE